ncbi:MAG TPA: methyltransferase domain-containing protein [Bryobacteraceae bacterium]|nr:methyltransferase domain-containing protein [Bryobacteraceae bacterium]
MHEILSALPSGSKVLDLGSGSGSFAAEQLDLAVVRADLLPPEKRYDKFVVCRASELPFAEQTFPAIVLNHSLEHFENLGDALSELARVLTRSGQLYVAVHDRFSFTDRLYRWLSRGGGHINGFCDAIAIQQTISTATGLRHAGTRVLCTSLSFLNRRNLPSRPPGKLLLFGNGQEGVLRTLTLVLRCLDRFFGWRTSVYGWAFYFGEGLMPDLATWSNVCVRCGSGHPSSLLRMTGRVTSRYILPSVYDCPKCGARNFFTEDSSLLHLY